MFNQIFVDAIQQFLFVCLIVSVAVLNMSTNGYNYKKQLIQTFDPTNQDKNSINTEQDVWKYLQTKLAVGLRADQWYNGAQPYGLAGYANDFSSRMIGYAVLRQIRVKNSKLFYLLHGVKKYFQKFILNFIFRQVLRKIRRNALQKMLL